MALQTVQLTRWLSPAFQRFAPLTVQAQRNRDLDLPAEDVNIDTAKAAIEQVNKRLEASLTLKTSTETRALALATQCATLLSAVGGATLIEWSGKARVSLIHAGFTGAVLLVIAIICVYRAAKPTDKLYLPGRLPEELWPDLTAVNMTGPEFMLRLVAGLSDPMRKNESAQLIRATWFNRAIWIVVITPILSLASSLVPSLGLIHVMSVVYSYLLTFF